MQELMEKRGGIESSSSDIMSWYSKITIHEMVVVQVTPEVV